LEPSYWVLLENPFHKSPRRARLAYWIDQKQVESNNQEILFSEWVVKEKISSPNCSIFPAKIADFGLNYCILNVKTKNNISGRKQ